MFQGFSPETIDFLWGIRMNNNRDWFMAHKNQYIQTLYEPMKALGKELFEPFLQKPGNILKVSRIYRDARMHHAEPYKESLWICIRQECDWWGENPCLYFEIRPEGVSYGFFLWQPRRATLEAFRKCISSNSDTFLKLIKKTERTTGVPITAETYKRPPKPAPTKALERFFGWRGQIGCVIQEPFSEATFGPELGERVKDFLTKLIPLYEYFNQFCV